VEVFQGPVLGPSRLLGLGGAYAGVAEGVDGVASNVAAPAVRAPYSSHHVDYDLTASVSIPGSFSSTDFENRGSVPTGQQTSSASNFIYGNAGVLLQVGPFGAAFTIDASSYTLATNQNGLYFHVLGSPAIVRAHAIVGWAFMNYQLVVGVGVCGVAMSLGADALPLAPPSGIGPEAGLLLRLDDQPWRLGVSARAPVNGGIGGDVTTAADGVKSATGNGQSYILPTSVVLPAQIDVGFALQLGPRPLNPKWFDPSGELEPLRQTIEDQRIERAKHDADEIARTPAGPLRAKLRRELDANERAIRRLEDVRVDAEEKRIQADHGARYTNWPRAKLLLVLDAVITVPVSNAVAVSSFFNQQLESYGRSWTISPRLGLEGEPVVDRFRLRFGTYLEPSLFDGGSARQHFTFGGDLKLFQWNAFGLLAKTEWQLSFATDLAPRYTNWGLSIGVWR